MKHLKKRNILSVLFTVVLISIFVTGCGNDKKETSEKSEDPKKTESNSGNSGMTESNNMDKSMSSDHIMINLPTMQCGTCKKNIETAVKKMDGIESINVDKTEKVAHINYDKSKTDLTKIEAVIVAAGYDANDKKADPEGYKDLDDCCKMPKDQKKKE